ncbi:ELKS/Rab6-interacting/CAST family member 1-like isoform X6 [Leptidea sinapis]|uniref:ELKS/Rab6-interacting/CAST family member 1-like isoform X6 n=1 Tax=Leptidea sinapis TaxID=189913 RepID=UPI0021C2BADC|nr:ELKS/Rab6-interacting/CAST family member 1-like isoform X6 [Leptidea sinapis]
MHSIKTFWSPELKKERALRKEESAKYSLINDQLKLLNQENQKQAMLVRQLEEELRLRMRQPAPELQQQLEALYAENEHLQREIAILRDTIKELELRIETQKQTLQARDESIKKLLEMLQNKGMGKEEERQMFQQMQAMAQKQELKSTAETLRALQMQLERALSAAGLPGGSTGATLTAVLETKEARIATLERQVALLESELSNYASLSLAPSHASLYDRAEPFKRQLDEFRLEIQRRDQEILAMAAKMKALEEQHQDYQRHIAVLKESLCAKEEHYSMLQTDVEELKARLDEKSRLVEKKTASALAVAHELSELRDHSEIKDRKINVLQRKLDLREANKKLQAGQSAKAGEDTAQAKKQLQEEYKKLEDARKQFEDNRRAVDNKRKDVEEKEKSLMELDRQLKKRKEQMDQMEASLRKAGGSTAAVTEMNRKLTDTQKEADEVKKQLNQSQEESKRLATETERLLQLVQMSQEEQAQKEKQIMELQQSVRNLQAKLKSQQQAQAQKEEELNRARQSEIAAIKDLTDTLKERDRLKRKLEENKMKLIDFEIELNESSLILSEVLKISDSQELNNIKKTKSFFELQKSGKVVDRLDKCRFTRSYNDLLNLSDKNNQSNIYKLTRKITALTKEIEIKNSKIIEQQKCISILEDALRENNNIAEFEQLLTVIRSKDERINDLEEIINNKSSKGNHFNRDKRILELEEALKESFMIAAEREKVFYEEEKKRIENLKKMEKMQQRLHSLQNASALNCNTCSAALKCSKNLEVKLNSCQLKRDKILQHFSYVIQDLLEKAITEKDVRIAELEVKGVLDEKETKIYDVLKADRVRMLNRLRDENAKILEFGQETPEQLQVDSLPLTYADELLTVCNENVIIWEEDLQATVL